MSQVINRSAFFSAVLATLFFMGSAAHALTDDEVKSIMKKSNCFKCHTETKDKPKDGPPYAEVAEYFKKEKNAEADLYKRLTTVTKVKIKDEKKDHEPLKTKDDAEIKAVIRWILSR